MARTRTSWQPGTSGNPRGRPPLSPDRWPKVRDIVLGVLAEERATVEATLRRALKSPRRTVQILELAARLGLELNPRADNGIVSIQVVTAIPMDTMAGRPALDAGSPPEDVRALGE